MEAKSEVLGWTCGTAPNKGLRCGQHQTWAGMDFEKWLPTVPLYHRPGPLARDLWASGFPLQAINT